tara:strand:- start:66 stop:458 length:393 start_codon:yes stop_codon:yes gene_type:complete
MNSLQGIQSSSPLSEYFFSRCNMKTINDEIRYRVWLESKRQYKIGNQDESQLQMIMRSIYLQEALNQPDNIEKQVLELNKSVIAYAIPRIMTEVKQHVTYNEDIQKERQIMPHSVNPSIKGFKNLEYKPW